jgi:hypothetical protein
VAAIFVSFQQNAALIGQQAGALSAPVIGVIHAIGQQAAANFQATQARNDIQNSSFYKTWDDRDKRNAGFSNYLLDYSVVRDTENPADHATLWNTDADELMRRFPGRIELVPNADLMKYKDYRPYPWRVSLLRRADLT